MKPCSSLMTGLILWLYVAPTPCTGEEYQKATDLDEIVLEKLFPKSGRLEASVDVGTILNQSFVDTTLMRIGGIYYWDESWGLGLNVATARNKDKTERSCIESFYNDPKIELTEKCASQDESGDIQNAEAANIGPAYLAVREIKDIFLAESVFSPTYGKQIFFLGVVSHFDLQLKLGAGVTRSIYYEQRSTVKNDSSRPSRGSFSEDASQQNPGVSPDDTANYGVAGRPEPQTQIHATLVPAISQKFYFARRFSWNLDLGSIFILGTPSGFDYFLTLSTGVSLRF